MVRNSKGQVWSIDLVMGLLVFALIIVIFYSLLAGDSESKIDSYTTGADVLTQKMYDKGLVNSLTGEINEDKYINFSEQSYQDLKEELGVSGEFCLFVETNDNPPRLLIINNMTGIGSGDFYVGGFACGTNVALP